jgi:general secretion pathway protein G
VELLIVIVIIGILAAAMMLSSGSATAAAEASNIISDLRTMKAAALMFYADSQDVITPGLALNVSYISPYMDNPAKFSSGSPYRFDKDTSNKWYVGYDLGAKTPDVKSKLAGKANSTGLMKSKALNDPYNSASTAATVWMVAR